MRRRRRHDNCSGGLAQLARALDLHSRGQGFDSLILHKKNKRGTPLAIREEKFIPHKAAGTPLSSTILEIIEGRLSNKKEIISGNSSAVYKSLNKRRSTNLIIGLNELIFVIKRKFIDKLGSWITRETTCYPEMDNVEVEEN